MAATASNRRAADRLVARVEAAFHNLSHTRYWIEVSYYQPFAGYNVFFCMSHPRRFTRSLPVGEYDHCRFADLVQIIRLFRQHYHFSIIYRGFSKEQLRRLKEERCL